MARMGWAPLIVVAYAALWILVTCPFSILYFSKTSVPNMARRYYFQASTVLCCLAQLPV